MLHQVGVSFDLYYDARKRKIKKIFCVLLLLCGYFAMDCDKTLFNFFGLSSYYVVIVSVCEYSEISRSSLEQIGWKNIFPWAYCVAYSYVSGFTPKR